MKLLPLFFLLLFSFSYSQSKGFDLANDNRKQVIHFQLINNLVFVPVNINGTDLTFLLDTGVSETILFSLENKSVNFNDVEKINFSGLGENNGLEGLKSENNKVHMGNEFEDPKHTIYIILSEEFNFSSHVGIPVHGIIGYQFFKNNPIEINYLSKTITIYKDHQAVPRKIKKFDSFPITIEYNKPYIVGDVVQTKEKKESKMLIDMGNSDAIWLFPSLIPNFSYNQPNIEDYLGRGFNGDISGKRSRIHYFYLGNFRFEKPIAAMPDEFSVQHVKVAPGRKGSIGGDILRRFTILMDYPNKKIYLKKNTHYNDPFLFNMSGLDFKHDGAKWENDYVKVEAPKRTKETENGTTFVFTDYQYKLVLKPIYSIAGVRKDSPAYKAGLRKGDLLVSINGKSATSFTLESLVDLMKSGEGNSFTFVITRKGETLKYNFVLEDPIPYNEQ